jgi:hypothetical protein
LLGRKETGAALFLAGSQMIETAASFLDPKRTNRGLIISLNEAGECQIAILDLTAKVDDAYPVLGKVVVPHEVLMSIGMALPAALSHLIRTGCDHVPTPTELMDTLLPMAKTMREEGLE